MGKTAKKAPKPRNGSKNTAKKTSGKPENAPVFPAANETEHCICCGKTLKSDDQALFVEEEVGRVFCSEDCIVSYFSPEIQNLEEEFNSRYSAQKDFNDKEREQFNSFKLKVLEGPDEIWRERTLAGDFRYYMIGEFLHRKKPFWVVCISLFLRGEPSFLYMTIVTKDPKMLDFYRRGEKVEWVKPSASAFSSQKISLGENEESAPPTDRLAESFTEEETFRANLMSYRRDDDIPVEEFEQYQDCVEQTLQTPDEVWSWSAAKTGSPNVYHFLKGYPARGKQLFFIILARETTNPEQLEILEAFPTRDPAMVERFRVGTQEIGGEGHQKQAASSRVLH